MSPKAPTTAGLPLVDLFAGCGGLSLGLEASGFVPVFVNELHPDALASYLGNRQHLPVNRGENHCNDIRELTNKPDELMILARRLRREHGEVALVAGGPPCQGFSGIGHRRSFQVRREEIPSNHLYKDMAKVIEALKPRAFLFENVRGLLAARWSSEGEKGEIWRDIQKVFSSITTQLAGRRVGYVVRSAVLRSGDYGVPQNRPRVILVGIREDLAPTMAPDQLADGFLPEPVVGAPDPYEVWADLIDPNWVPGGETPIYPTEPKSELQEILRTLPTGQLMTGKSLTEQEYSKHSERVSNRFQALIDSNGATSKDIATNKFSQRLIPKRWGPDGPNITVTSLPDDYVHFAQPRTPTVRECARLQTFPDWYRFIGKRTTGGRKRAGDPSNGQWYRDLPKYTQIGNAVPVTLATVVGRHLIRLVA